MSMKLNVLLCKVRDKANWNGLVHACLMRDGLNHALMSVIIDGVPKVFFPLKQVGECIECGLGDLNN